MPGVSHRPAPRPCRRRRDARGDRRRFGPMPHGVLARQQHPHRPAVPSASVRAAAGDRRRDLARRTRRRWRAATPARRRARTTTRRSRGRRARPRRSGGSRAQSPAGSVERRLDRRPWCGGPAPCRPRRGPRPGSRRRPSRRRPSGTATSASGGAVSSAKPPSPSATVRRRPAAGCAPRSSARRRRRVQVARGAPAPARRPTAVPGVEDRPPAGAAAQVGRQRPTRRAAVVVAGALGPQAGEPHDDPGRAEAALAGAGGAERVGPGRALLGGEARRAS